ncbi:MAG: tetratricopeptide repeat protein [Nitrospinae bacterium]|nr:tetratricopeptide repeat protein [Nitrospinota bacterium]
MSGLKERALSIAFIAACGLLAFGGTLQSPFHYDDLHAIVRNPYIKELGKFQEQVGIGNIFNRSALLLTFAVNRELGGLNVFGYHLLNLLLHVWVGILLYFVAGELLALEREEKRPSSVPLLAAVLFLLNPMTTQPATYLSSRSALLATFFYLLSFYCFARFVNGRGEKGRASWHDLSLPFLAGAFFFLGLGSKEIAVTLPVVATFYWLFRQNRPPEAKDWAKWAMILLSPLAVYIAVRAALFGNPFAVIATESGETAEGGRYLVAQFRVIVFYYLLKWFLPVNLNFEPDVRLAASGVEWESVLAAGALVLLGMGFRFQKSRLARFGALWAITTLLPESSFIQLKQVATEHRMYLPGVGVSLFLSVWLNNLRRFSPASATLDSMGLTPMANKRHRGPSGLGQPAPGRSPAARAAVFAILVAVSALAVQRSLVYRSEVLLWEDTARKSPMKILVHNNLASYYIDRKRYADALRELDTILRLDPAHALAHANRGYIHFLREEWEKAREEYDQALFYGAGDAANLYYAGMTRLRLKTTPGEAIPFLERSAALSPENPEFHFALGDAYRETGRYDDSAMEYRLAIQHKPDHMQAHNNLGVVFWNLKSFRLAEEEFARALDLAPGNAEARVNLAGVYLALGEPQNAIPHLERVLALQPGNAYAQKLVAAAQSANVNVGANAASR